MNEVLVKFVTDTGSPVTIINEQTRIKIGAIVNTNVNKKHKMITANGATSKILGSARAKLRIKEWETEADVLVIENLVKDCLLGLDILESCPLTSRPMKNLREALEAEMEYKTSEKTKHNWYQVAVSPAKEFFDGIQEQCDKQRRLEERAKQEKEVTVRMSR